ncbi:hypothetical protein DACRYDRAFT_77730 [Dacryopinax primogenitus]|uniref:EamA domain-containing protein n=1 Tax=Dacryopinax primogenitus (strain DJM 731) TaxID=1858805 RepID=M5G112_DACPD|nr:uncharacterized protein DACRYDRAFT_77730 [Dacryopinax primogenitus]EJU03936.1 hypothetical protein DACRYDRAFT_77730 [Dacryopinax primogenitus]
MSADRANYAFGIALLVIVVFEWTFSNFLTQHLFITGYNKPFLITYLNTSTFSLYLLPQLGKLWWERKAKGDEARGDYSVLAPEAPVRGRRVSLERVRSAHSLSPPHLPPPPQEGILPPLTVREHASLGAIFCVLWFAANWSVNASLEYTSVASSTILASMSGFFTLVIGRMFGVELFTLAKLGAVIASFSGILLVSLSDGTSDKPSTSAYVVLGDMLALLSALFYALYVLFLKIRAQHESRLNAQLFFGFVGLFNTFGLWPIAIVLHLTGIEPFALPTDGMAWGALGLNMFITLSSDYLYVLAMLKTTPLVVTIGLSLTIPLAVLGDMWMGHWATLQTVFGAVLVLFAFSAVGYDSAKEVRALELPREDLETTYGAVTPPGTRSPVVETPAEA